MQLLFIFIIYFLQVGKVKVTAKWGLEILSIHCQNFAIIMTNGIRRCGYIDKRILDSSKFISDKYL